MGCSGSAGFCWKMAAVSSVFTPQSKPSTRSTWVQSATVGFLTCTITSSTATRLPSCFVRKTEAQGGRPGLQIEGEPIALAFLSPIVSSVGEHAHVEQRNGLHLLVPFGEGAVHEEVVAGLLDHVLQGDEGRLILRKPLLQGFDGLCDRLAILARRSRLGFGANEAFGEDGLDQVKDLLALGLGT